METQDLPAQFEALAQQLEHPAEEMDSEFGQFSFGKLWHEAVSKVIPHTLSSASSPDLTI